MTRIKSYLKSLDESTTSLMQSLAILLVLVAIAFLLSKGVFLRPNNLVNLGRQNAMLLFVALAQLVVLLTGGIDLSVGAVVAISSVLVVLFQGYGIGLALCVALAVGALIGTISGILVTGLRLPAFVITLAMQQIVYSVAKVMTNGAKVEHSLNGAMLSMSLSRFYKMKTMGLIIPIWLCIAVIIVMTLYMRTKQGYYLYAIGGNSSAARFSGLPVRLINILAYTLSSMLCAFAGFLFVCRVGTGDPDTGILLPMDAIAACTIGGVSLSGGKGSVAGAVIGLLVLCVLNNIMSLIHVSPNVQPMVKGIVILIAVFMNSVKKNGEN
jgi:Ribose/xylose/arabinose/galactoside ABC-type transport systems, permease components